MFRLAATLLARKASKKAGRASATRARKPASVPSAALTAGDVAALRASVMRRRAAIENAMRRRTVKRVPHARKAASRPTPQPRKTAKKTAASTSTRARQPTPLAISDATSWVSVMSAALQKRVALAAHQMQGRPSRSVATAPKATSVAVVAAPKPPMSAQLAAYEVKDQKAIDAVIAATLGRSRPAQPAVAKKVKAAPRVIASDDAPPLTTSPSSTTVAAPTSGLLPAPRTFLSRDWVELDSASAVPRLEAILAERARAVAPATPPSAKPLALRNPAHTHLVHLDVTKAYTQTLLVGDAVETRIRTQLHAPLFDDSVTAEKVNPLSQWRTLEAPASGVSAYDSGATAPAEAVVVALTTCSPTEAAAIEAGWSAYYVQAADKPLFSVAQLRASPAAAAPPSVHLSSATVARVVVLSADESKKYLAQAKARQSFTRVPAAKAAGDSAKAPPSPRAKRRGGANAAKAAGAPPSSAVAHPSAARSAEASAGDDVSQLVEDALKCALENTKREIAVFVQSSVRDTFAECEAVRRERHEVAWRRYQQCLIAQASRRRGALTPAQRNQMTLAGTPAPVFLEASQQQIDDAVAKAVDLAIGKLHGIANNEKPE